MPERGDNEENSARGQTDGPLPQQPNSALARVTPGAQPPLETKGPDIVHRHTSAAGLYSIYETVKRGSAQMGVKRSFRTLLTVNQKDGFDCPSCAWPDPDGERKAAEFCENGAKAVGSEATLARITPDFFAQHSIPDLLAQSDAWHERQGRITQPMHRAPGSDHYRPISWDDAFALIGRELNALGSPNEAS